jgi:trigger factor
MINLKLEITPIEGHQVKLTVEADTDQLNRAKQNAARNLAKKARIPGFRPGKAPYNVIVKHFGEEAIIEEAIEILANDLYPKALDEGNVKPFGPGTLQNVVSRDPAILEFVVPLEAEVVLGDYRSLRIPYEAPVIEEKEIEEVLQNLAENNVILEPVDRPVTEGDEVTVKINGKRVDPDESGNVVLISDQTVPIIVRIDPDNRQEWPYPGFSASLVGLRQGEVAVFQHTFAEDTPYKNLKGVKAEFEVIIQEVKSRTIPAFDDEFARTMGEFQTIHELKEQIRQDLLDQKVKLYNDTYEDEVLAKIIEISEFKFPPQMLEQEIDSLIQELERRLGEQKLDLDLYLKTRQMDISALREETRPHAEERLKRSLTLYELAEKEKITISPDQLQQETTQTIQSLSQSLPGEEIKRLNNRNVVANIMNNVMVDLLSRTTRERIRLIASGNWDQQPISNGEASAELSEPPENNEVSQVLVTEEPILTENNSQKDEES